MLWGIPCRSAGGRFQVPNGQSRRLSSSVDNSVDRNLFSRAEKPDQGQPFLPRARGEVVEAPWARRALFTVARLCCCGVGTAVEGT